MLMITRIPCVRTVFPSALQLSSCSLIIHSSRRTSIRSLLPRLYATMAPIERITDRLETSSLDDRSYRVVRLPNKLEALLVHDPETDKASASVNVNVGSFSDADDMPGMAHAVEHLLFMGTEKVTDMVIHSPKEVS